MTPTTVLHLGLGSFHRAHQAVYLQRLHEAGDRTWSIVGGNIRPDMEAVVEALAAQDCRYTVETVSTAGERTYTQVGAIGRVVPWSEDLAGLVAAGADPATRIISFTVTEAGYYLDPANAPDPSFPDLAADIEAVRAGRPVRTLYGALTLILRARRAAQAGPVTLLNCDNLRHNGDRSRKGFLGFLDLVGDGALKAWVEAHTTSPNAMVDRITPRPTPAVRDSVRAATGRDDAAALMAEDFLQWVIEDRFAAGRPAFERVGVEMVSSVDPYEEAKIRILNASHSAIAWAGSLKGYRYIHEGTLDEEIRGIAQAYVTDDVIPCLTPSPLDLAAYRDTVLSRFANVAIADTNQRVAADGFSKIPGFIAPTIRERLAAGGTIVAVAALPALFLAFLERWAAGDIPWTYQDQAMDPAVARAIVAAPDPVAALVAERPLWAELTGDRRLESAIRAARARLAPLSAQASA